MSAEEIYEIAKIFVKFGVNKIRLTGGEPLVRKDFIKILNLLSTLNIELSLTTNAVSVDRYFNELKKWCKNVWDSGHSKLTEIPRYNF